MPNLKVVNTDTGEIISAVADVKYESVDEYVMVFLNTLPILESLKGSEKSVLHACWILSTFNPKVDIGNVIINDTYFKDRVRLLGFNLTDGIVNNAISVLSKKNILIKRCKGSYYLNPAYFFKGTLTDRSKLAFRLQKQAKIENNENFDNK